MLFRSTVTVRGTDGNDVSTSTFTLTFLTPNQGFAIESIPARTIYQGQTAAFPISVLTAEGAAPGAQVTLSVDGIPPASTSSFSVNPVVTTANPATSTLSIATDPNMSSSIGVYTIRVTGTFGAETHTVQTTLTVNPAPVWTILPVSSQTVSTGQTAIFPITVQQVSGTPNAVVTLSVTGISSGYSYSIDPNPVTATIGGTPCTLSVFPSEKPTRGIPNAYTLTITGTDGAHTETVTTVLTINNPLFASCELRLSARAHIARAEPAF